MLSTENGISGVGVHFAGDFDMDVGQRIGTGDITFTDCKLNKAKTALKKQDYNISIDVVHQLNEEGAIIADQSMMYFALDSAVNTALNGESWHKNIQGNTKGNRFRGYFSVQSLNDNIGVAEKFLSGEDARFSKYFDWITASLGASAITDITNNKFGGLVTLRVLTDIQYGDDYVELHLNPELLGMEGDPVVTIHYDSHNQLKSLTINMVMSDGKALDLTVSLKDSYHPVAENWRVNNFKNGARDVSNFINFSTIELLLEYGLGSAMLGVEEEGASILTDSTYRLTLSTDLSLGILPLPVHIYLDIFIYVNGSTVKVWGNFVVPGLLGIKGFSYKTTTTTFAYSTTGNGPIHEEFGETHDTGDLYIHSHHYVGGFAGIGTKERNDYWKVRGGSFIKNIGEWLLIAFMGNDGTVLEDSSSSATADKQIYIEDVISSYSFSGSDGNSPIWDVKVDLDALVEGIFTGDDNEIGAKIYGVGSENGDVDTRTLSKVDLTVNIHFIFSIKLTGTIYLDNVNQTTGAYTECWNRVYGKNLESGSAYTTSAASRWSSLISKVSSSTSGYSVSPK